MEHLAWRRGEENKCATVLNCIYRHSQLNKDVFASAVLFPVNVMLKTAVSVLD